MAVTEIPREEITIERVKAELKSGQEAFIIYKFDTEPVEPYKVVETKSEMEFYIINLNEKAGYQQYAMDRVSK